MPKGKTALELGVELVSAIVKQETFFKKGVTVFFHHAHHSPDNNNGLGIGIYGDISSRDLIICATFLLRKAKEMGANIDDVMDVILNPSKYLENRYGAV